MSGTCLISARILHRLVLQVLVSIVLAVVSRLQSILASVVLNSEHTKLWLCRPRFTCYAMLSIWKVDVGLVIRLDI